jgi:hypothetical protein
LIEKGIFLIYVQVDGGEGWVFLVELWLFSVFINDGLVLDTNLHIVWDAERSL